MTDPHADPVAHALHDAAAGFDRGAAGIDKALAGEYTSADAARDYAWAVSTSMHWVSALAECWTRIMGPGQDPAEFAGMPAVGMVGERVHVPLRHHVTTHPIDLAPSGFRAIGWGNQFLLPLDAFQFAPGPSIGRGVDSFGFTMLRDRVPASMQRYTLIFEGMVVDAATGAGVAGPVRIVKPATS